MCYWYINDKYRINYLNLVHKRENFFLFVDTLTVSVFLRTHADISLEVFAEKRSVGKV